MSGFRQQKGKDTAGTAHQIRWLVLAVSLLPLFFLTVLRPLSLSRGQCVTIGILCAVVIWWATGAVPQVAASLILLAGFVLFSGASPATVFFFPLSENFALIAVSFLFSQGIVNSHLSQKILKPLLARTASTPARLLLTMIGCSFIVALFVPQSISRTFIVTALFSDYLDACGTASAERKVWMLGLFSTGFLVGQLFPRGDIVLNYSLMTVSGLVFSDGQWVIYLALPTVCLLLVISAVFLWLFRRELQAYCPSCGMVQERVSLTRRDLWSLILIVTVGVLWSTEDIHGIEGLYILCAGTLLMFPLGLLRLKDLKAVNLPVLVYLTAAFSIGKVIVATGLSQQLFGNIGAMFPSVFSWKYALLLIIAAMGIHMVLGSNVSALAAGLPILSAASAGTAPEVVACLLAYLAISQQFLLPFHHVTLAAGVGRGDLAVKDVLRLGAVMTPIVLISGVLLYLNWWKLLGLW